MIFPKDNKKIFLSTKLSSNGQNEFHNSRYVIKKPNDDNNNNSNNQLNQSEILKLKLDNRKSDKKNEEKREKKFFLKNDIHSSINQLSISAQNPNPKEIKDYHNLEQKPNPKEKKDYHILNIKEKIQIIARDKSNNVENELINLIKRKRDIIKEQKEKNEYNLGLLDFSIDKYENEPSNINYSNLVKILNEIDNKICHDSELELSILGKPDLKNNIKFNSQLLLNKISALEKKALSIINCKFEINLTGKELKINLNGKNVTNLDLELLSGINFKYLEEIDLGNNNITNLDELKNLKSPNLKVINLTNNKIKDVEPLKYTSFPKLKKLDLSFNKIEDIEPIGDMMYTTSKQIEIINLDNNEIKNIAPIKENISLNIKDINLDNNQIIQKDIEEIKDIISENKVYSNLVEKEKNENKKKDKIIISYKINSFKRDIKLFNNQFIEKNKNKCYIIIDDKEEELREYYDIIEAEKKKKKKKLKKMIKKKFKKKKKKKIY